jgi:hypothetical protein
MKTKDYASSPHQPSQLRRRQRKNTSLVLMIHPPPGIKVMWRSLSRPTHIELGATVGVQLMGN